MSKSARRKANNTPAGGSGISRPAGKKHRFSWLQRWGWPIAVIAGLLLLLVVLHPSIGGGTTTGQDFKLVAYQGEAVLGGHDSTFSRVFELKKPVVLNFWAGNCPPCRVEMPGFQKVSGEFSGRVIFVGVDVGPYTGLGNHDDAARLYKELGITYPLAYAVDDSPLQIYNVQGMPTTVFLTAGGQVTDRATGILTEDQLRNEIQQKLLAG